MEARNFAGLKELYHPVFLKEPIDSQIAEAMRNAEYLHLDSSVRDRITELLSEYGWFRFTKKESISGDELNFFFLPLYYPYYLENNQSKAAFLGGFRNCSCSFYGNEGTRYMESFYIDAAGFIRNREHRLIAENIADFWEYIMEKEYDYHPEITDDVMNLLRGAGWYEGRKIQIAFVQEFGGLRGSGLIGDLGFFFASERMRRCFLNIAKEPVYTLERRILREYGADTLCVGYGNEGDFQIFLTADGQLLIRDIKVGRTIWEGIQCIVGY